MYHLNKRNQYTTKIDLNDSFLISIVNQLTSEHICMMWRARIFCLVFFVTTLFHISQFPFFNKYHKSTFLKIKVLSRRHFLHNELCKTFCHWSIPSPLQMLGMTFSSPFMSMHCISLFISIIIRTIYPLDIVWLRRFRFSKSEFVTLQVRMNKSISS